MLCWGGGGNGVMVMSSKGSLRMVGARTLRGEIFQVRETLQKLEQGGMNVVWLGGPTGDTTIVELKTDLLCKKILIKS